MGDPEYLYKLERGKRFLAKIKPEARETEVANAFRVVESALAEQDAKPNSFRIVLWTVGGVPPTFWDLRAETEHD